MSWLTTAEAANLLRCSVRSVHARTATCTIPHRKFGRACLFDEAELRAFLDGAELEVIKTAAGRVVRPKLNPAR